MWFPLLVTVATGYLLGNINGAVSVSALKHDDVRSHGSGNAGLTNYFRNFGGKSTFLVLLVDLVKTLLGCAVGLSASPTLRSFRRGRYAGRFLRQLGARLPRSAGIPGRKRHRLRSCRGTCCGLEDRR